MKKSNKLILIGQVTGTFGIKGELKVLDIEKVLKLYFKIKQNIQLVHQDFIKVMF